MTSQIVKWVSNHKLLVFFGVMTFSFFVSTVVLSVKNKNLRKSTDLTPELDNRFRLPDYVKPTNYELQLVPNILHKTFEGIVTISLYISRPTSTIILHTKDLDINSVELKDNYNQSLKVSSSNIITVAEILQVNLQEEVIANTKYYLRIFFSGKLDNGIVGFYSSTMRSGENLKRFGLFKYLIKNCLSMKTCRLISIHSINIMDNSYKIKLSERLCPLVRPVHYKLFLNPNLENGIFEGKVNINVILKQEKNNLALHTKFLEINDVKISKDSEEVIVAKFLEVKSLEQLLIQFDNNLTPGIYEINIHFNGSLTRNIVGYYLSHLKHKSTMVASKFQPTYARQAFPCFDEPEFKATYDITLVKPKDYVALSNMNEISRSLIEPSNSEVVTFATSVPMSTYLACFVVCNFDNKEVDIIANGIGNNFKLRSFAQKGQTHKIDFAQDIGKRATEFYIKYYEVPFPLPKLDMIAIPDYVSGATEHWGLITYRETSFLIDDDTASSRNKLSVANTVAHELAHMWFGNLVTMKWWDEVWLNEGFASYMQVKALNAIEPTWTMLDQFLTRTLHSVLVIDSKLSSHPIVQTVETPDEITAIFDSISYNKGASVLRMLEGFIGDENFRRGVSDYLKKYEYGNTITQDLLSSLEPYFRRENPNLSLTYIMDTWTRQMGYPLISVKASDKPNTYIVSQKRFLVDPEAKVNEPSKYNYRWFVPISYTTNKGRKENITWFPDNIDTIELTLQEGEDWLKINNNQVGYYRVNYEDGMWLKLINQLKTKSQQLSISDRSSLLDDAFALAGAQLLSYSTALNLSTYLEVETDYVPWETCTSIFADLSEKLLNTVAHEHLEKYIQKLIKPLYEKQTWERTNLSVIEGLLRARVLSLSSNYRLPEAETKVRSLFLSWLNSTDTQIEPDLRDFVYYHGMKSATLEEWDKLWQIYLKEEDAQEQSKLRSALSAPRDVGILKRYLNLAWDENNIRSQDYLNVVQLISSNPSGTALVWDDVRANWTKLVDRFTLNSRYLGSLIPGVTESFNTEDKLKEMKSFFAQYPEAGAGELSRMRALETVRNNIQWGHTHSDSVAAWLRNSI